MTARKEVTTVQVRIDTNAFVLPPTMDEVALEAFAEQYAERQPTDARLVGRSHYVGHYVDYDVEAKMLPEPKAEPVTDVDSKPLVEAKDK